MKNKPAVTLDLTKGYHSTNHEEILTTLKPFEKSLYDNGLENNLISRMKVLTEPEHQALLRHYAVDCAESVKHLMKDKRSLKALEIARLRAEGWVQDKELECAGARALDAYNNAHKTHPLNGGLLSSVGNIGAAETLAAHVAYGAVHWQTHEAAWFVVVRAIKIASYDTSLAPSEGALRGAFTTLMEEYIRTGKRVMNPQEIISNYIEGKTSKG